MKRTPSEYVAELREQQASTEALIARIESGDIKRYVALASLHGGIPYGGGIMHQLATDSSTICGKTWEGKPVIWDECNGPGAMILMPCSPRGLAPF